MGGALLRTTSTMYLHNAMSFKQYLLMERSTALETFLVGYFKLSFCSRLLHHATACYLFISHTQTTPGRIIAVYRNQLKCYWMFDNGTLQQKREPISKEGEKNPEL